MNILILTNTFPSVENTMNGLYVYRRCQELIRMGNNVEVVVVNHIRESRKKSYNYNICGQKKTANVINYFQPPMSNYQFFLKSKLKKIIRSFQIEIIHVHHVNSGFGAYLVSKDLNLPYVVTAHGSDIHTKLENKKHYIRSRKIIKGSSATIFVSKFLKEIALKYHLDMTNTIVINNGVDSPNALVVKSANNSRIIFIGSLIPIKRADKLVDIFRIVLKNDPQASLTIIGDGFQRELIRNIIQEYSLERNIRLTGQLPHDEVFSELLQSDILILPSLNEGFPCVVMEAQSCGLQVVVSNNGGMPEAVGDVGLVVPDSNRWIEDFANAIIKLKKNPISQNKIKGRINEFSWEKIVSQEIKVYKDVLNSNKN